MLREGSSQERSVVCGQLSAARGELLREGSLCSITLVGQCFLKSECYLCRSKFILPIAGEILQNTN